MSDFEATKTNMTEELEKDVTNPYAYLNRGDFTSEKYKIEIRGLPKYYGIGELKKLLNEKLNLDSSKVKPQRKGSDWVYVCFRNEESRLKAIAAINGISWKNSKLTAQIAKAAPDPFVKRKLEEKEIAFKKSKIDTNDKCLSPTDRVKFTTTPLWNVPYPNQLELKQKEMKAVLMKIGQQMAKENKNLGEWLKLQRNLHQGLPCELQTILSADITESYRNKCEFTVGKNEEGNKVIIGFRLSSYAAGSTAVGPIDELCHIPKSMKTAIKLFEDFVRNSELDAFNPVNHSGYWRQVTARTTRFGHLMLIIGMHPQDLSSDDLNKIKKDIRNFFEEGKGVEAHVTSLYFQRMTKMCVGGEGGITLEHLSGTEYIEEQLLDMTFRISPQAFFQVNTLGAEVLYKAAINLIQPIVNTALLDVCCGTGTIGLCFSKHCDEVLGLEMEGSAIKDAKENVVKNAIKNCEFFIGKAEDILSPVIQRTTRPNVIAVVDPPRAGLHQKALVTLRKAKKLTKIIYVSCDPKAAVKNLIDLARPSSKHYLGEPLVPIKAIPVDMFPHTRHCELIILLERLSQAKKSNECM